MRKATWALAVGRFGLVPGSAPHLGAALPVECGPTLPFSEALSAVT